MVMRDRNTDHGPQIETGRQGALGRGPPAVDHDPAVVSDDCHRSPTAFRVRNRRAAAEHDNLGHVASLATPGGHPAYISTMPVTIGFNHVATLTTDMDLTVRFYEKAFDAVVTFEVKARDDHPWMKILDLGGGAALNVFEVPADEIIGERRRQGGRGAIDHYALAVDSRGTLETVKKRLADAGAQEVGDIQRLGDEWSLFFRDPDGMELEVCCSADD
jgi:catechol 2,3-dioxygenase-like lactoylglutathione lyase family enzyme